MTQILFVAAASSWKIWYACKVEADDFGASTRMFELWTNFPKMSLILHDFVRTMGSLDIMILYYGSSSIISLILGH